MKATICRKGEITFSEDSQELESLVKIWRELKVRRVAENGLCSLEYVDQIGFAYDRRTINFLQLVTWKKFVGGSLRRNHWLKPICPSTDCVLMLFNSTVGSWRLMAGLRLPKQSTCR